MRITSVTTLKTASFRNVVGSYIFQSVREKLMFGYDLKPVSDGRILRIARPEKALLDILYLYPEYSTGSALEELRLDEDFLDNQLDRGLFREYLKVMDSRALETRAGLLFTVYAL